MTMRLTRLLATGVAMALALSAAPFSVSPARAEVNEVRISKGFGVHYLPMYVIQHEKLVEKHAAAAGLGHVTVQWPTIDGGNVINDAILAGPPPPPPLASPPLPSPAPAPPRNSP